VRRERRAFHYHISAYSAVSAVKLPFCSGVIYKITAQHLRDPRKCLVAAGSRAMGFCRAGSSSENLCSSLFISGEMEQT
jgi:hypothetical protein